MTTAHIIALVHQLDEASRQARNWTQAGTCHPGTSNDRPCQQAACIERAVRYSHYWARDAAHMARRLQQIAKRASRRAGAR